MQPNVPDGQIAAVRGCVGPGAPGPPWEPARGPAPRSVGVSAPRVIPQGGRKGKAAFQWRRTPGAEALGQRRSPTSPQHRGGLCGQLGKGTLGSDPVPAAGSVGTPSPPSLPSPPPRLPERPWLRAPLSRAAPSHDTSGMAHAQHRSGCAHRGGRDLRGARQPSAWVHGGGSLAVSPGCSALAASPGLAGLWFLARQSPTPSPRLPPAEEERPPASSAPHRRALGEPPGLVGDTGWDGVKGPPAPPRGLGQPQPSPRLGIPRWHRLSPTHPPSPLAAPVPRAVSDPPRALAEPRHPKLSCKPTTWVAPG